MLRKSPVRWPHPLSENDQAAGNPLWHLDSSGRVPLSVVLDSVVVMSSLVQAGVALAPRHRDARARASDLSASGQSSQTLAVSRPAAYCRHGTSTTSTPASSSVTG